MDPISDTMAAGADPEATAADIDPEVVRKLDSLSERQIRQIARANGIVLTARAGNKRSLLAELSRKLREKRRQKRKGT